MRDPVACGQMRDILGRADPLYRCYSKVMVRYDALGQRITQ